MKTCPKKALKPEEITLNNQKVEIAVYSKKYCMVRA